MIPAVDVRTEVNGRPAHVGRAYFTLRRGRLSTLFHYEDAYLANPHAFAIDPSLPLLASAHHCDGIPGSFRDSAPDRWGRNLIAKRERERAAREGDALRSLDEVDFLLGVFDRSRQGALRFFAPDSDEPLSTGPEIPPLIKLPALLDASRSVARGEEGLGELKLLLNAGSGSLGGARPKASVVDEGRLLLAKFSHPNDDCNVMAWEKTMLDLAHAAGIATPNARLVPVGDERVLVLERFDRTGSLVDGPRLPYASAMTLLAAEDGDQHDYGEIAEQLGVFAADPTGSLKELFARAAFSIAVHNVDDHLRNHGLVRERGGWKLAPLFDVNPDPHIDAPRATTFMGESGANEAAGLAALLPEFGLKRENAARIVGRVLAATGQWKAVARRNGCTAAEIKLFEPVFDNRRRALATAFGL